MQRTAVKSVLTILPPGIARPCKPCWAPMSEIQEQCQCDSSSVQEGPQNGHCTPTPLRQAIKGGEETDDIHPASALLFLKSSEPQGRHSRPQTASR